MKKITNIKYYDNKESHGKIIDWDLVKKEYRKLKCPSEFFDPTTVNFYKAKYNALMSERKTGKTTNLLLIGLVAYQLYGCITQYIRQTEDMTAPSVASELFKTILSYEDGRYIKQITDDKYNSIYYHSRKIYLCKRDENGEMEYKDNQHFFQFLSIDNNYQYKSVYNAPDGDLIVFDEFISKYYRDREWVDFLDLLSTIIRSRKTPVVFMLANTINLNSHYFKELEISREVKKMKTGDKQYITTEKGTVVYVEIIGLKPTTIKSEINRLFFGFKNPKIAAITGGDQTWAFDEVQHIWHNDNDKIIARNFKLDCDDVMLTLELVDTEDRGIIVNVYECTRTHDDSIIMTLGDITSKNQIWGIGSDNKICRMLWKLYTANKWYYDSNETGSLVDNYVKTYKQRKR